MRLFRKFALFAMFPDLLFMSGMGMGGYGRLTYSENTKRYELLDGRINIYVVDGQKIRPMRPDEGGGTMGNPNTVVALDGKLFGNSAYSEIHEFDAVTGAIGEKFSYAPFNFGGGAQDVLYASEKALLVTNGAKLFTLDSRLRKLGEKTLPRAPGHVMVVPELIHSKDKLYAVECDNPNTYTDCAGGCNLPVVFRQVTVDFSNPADIKVETHEEKVVKQEYFLSGIVDTVHQGWFLGKSGFGKGLNTIAYHSFAHLAEAAGEVALPEGVQIAAATRSAPAWMVLEKHGSPAQLAHADWNGKALTLAQFPLEWVKGSYHTFAIASDGANLLFVAALHQLAAYDVSGASPRLLLQQDFLSGHGGSAFQIHSLSPVTLPKAVLAVNRARLESELAKSYWNDSDQLAIHSEIDKLQPSDTWAIAPLTELLKKRQLSFQGGLAYATQGLAKFGTAASSAVPSLIYSTMEGSAIRGDALPLVTAAIAKIDPQGTATRAVQDECVRKTYVCAHVIKQVLAGLPR